MLCSVVFATVKSSLELLRHGLRHVPDSGKITENVTRNVGSSHSDQVNPIAHQNWHLNAAS